MHWGWGHHHCGQGMSWGNTALFTAALVAGDVARDRYAQPLYASQPTPQELEVRRLEALAFDRRWRDDLARAKAEERAKDPPEIRRLLDVRATRD